MEVAKWTVIDAVLLVERKILYVSFGEGGHWLKMVTGKSVASERVRP
jgi:dihydroxyacetone kinase